MCECVCVYHWAMINVHLHHLPDTIPQYDQSNQGHDKHCGNHHLYYLRMDLPALPWHVSLLISHSSFHIISVLLDFFGDYHGYEWPSRAFTTLLLYMNHWIIHEHILLQCFVSQLNIFRSCGVNADHHCEPVYNIGRLEVSRLLSVSSLHFTLYGTPSPWSSKTQHYNGFGPNLVNPTQPQRPLGPLF